MKTLLRFISALLLLVMVGKADAFPGPFPFSHLGGADAVFTANAVDFDGTNDFIARGADLTGNADAKVGTMSVWFRLDGTDGSNIALTQGTGSTYRIRRNAANKILVTAENSGGTEILRLLSTATFTTSASWVHVLAAWDLAVPVAHLFIDDADDEAAGSTETDDTIDYTVADHAVGALTTGSQKFNGCLSEVYLNLAEFLDISVQANRRKFIDAGGKPVDLGSDGSTPTGTAPIVYLNGDSTNFQTNQGTGGNYTVTGSLDDCSTSPTD